MTTQQEYEQMSAAEKKKEDWMNSKWRPAMGWMYMVVCFFDFVGAPILWSLLQAVFHGGVNVQWQPLTLQGAGLFHVAMGAVLGLAAWGRTQEKLNGANNGGIPLPASGGTTYTPPAPIQPTVPTTVVTPTPTPAATPAPSFGTPAPVFASSSGKLAPTQPDFPER
jgi:hypothetical protein